MAQYVEPMDIDSESDNKENSFIHCNVLSCTEKGYEELDVSELNMKLRYPITPANSPMSKSYTANSIDNRTFDSGDSTQNRENGNLTRSLNSNINKNDVVKKLLPLQMLPSEQIIDKNRNSSVLKCLDATTTETNNVTITVSGISDVYENLSLPSTSSSALHTPEATTPTKEIPRSDGGSPIMRGLKSVLNMFRSSQSPIPPTEDIIKTEVLSPTDSTTAKQIGSGDAKPQSVLASTPISAQKHKDGNASKRSSPYKDSIVFKDDLEKELEWKDETTIFLSHEKIPVHKLIFQQSKNIDMKLASNINTIGQSENINSVNSTVEYMDISYNDSILKEKPLTETQASNKEFGESDSEFVDCETISTRSEDQIVCNQDEFNKTEVTNLVVENIEAKKPGDDMISNKNPELNQSVDLKNETEDTIVMSTSIVLPANETFTKTHLDSINESFRQPVSDDSINIATDLSMNFSHKISDVESQQNEDNSCIKEMLGNEIKQNFNSSLNNSNQDTLINNTVITDYVPSIDINITEVNGTDMGVEKETLSNISITNSLIKRTVANVHESSEDIHNIEYATEVKCDIVLPEAKTSNDLQELQPLKINNSISAYIKTEANKNNDNEIQQINIVEKQSNHQEISCKILEVSITDKEIMDCLQSMDNNITEDNESVIGIEEKKLTTSSFIKKIQSNFHESSQDVHNKEYNNELNCNIVVPEANPSNCVQEVNESLSSFTKTQKVSVMNSDVNEINLANIEKTSNQEMLTKEVEVSEFNKYEVEAHAIKHTENKILYEDKVISSIENKLSNEASSFEKVSNTEFAAEKCTEINIENMNINVPGLDPINEVSCIPNDIPLPEEDDLEECTSNTFHREKSLDILPDLLEGLSTEIELVNAELVEELPVEVLPVENFITDDLLLEATRSNNVKLSHDLENKFKSVNTINKEQCQEVTESQNKELKITNSNAHIEENQNSADNINTVLVMDVVQNFIPTNIIDEVPSVLDSKCDEKPVHKIDSSKTDFKDPIDISAHNKLFFQQIENVTTAQQDIALVQDQIDSIFMSKDNKPVPFDKLLEPVNMNMTHDIETKTIESIDEQICNIIEDVVVSENNSPFASITNKIELIPESKSSLGDNCDELNKPCISKLTVAGSPPISPVIASKGTYNFNFDEIDDPFATKTKVRVSPPLETSNKSLVSTNFKKDEKCNMKKDFNKNKRKSLPERKKPVPASVKKLNNTITSSLNVTPKSVENDTLESQSLTILREEKIELSMANMVEKLSNPLSCIASSVLPENSHSDVTSSLTANNIKDNEKSYKLDQDIRVDTDEFIKASKLNNSGNNFDNDLNEVHEISIVSNEIKNVSSSEQSTYFSAGTSSSESISRNVFNLPEIHDVNFKPHTNKSIKCQSSSLDLEKDPFTTKNKINFSPESSLIINSNDSSKNTHTINNDVTLTSDPNSENKIEGELMEKETSINMSNTTRSSNATDENEVTIKEVHTEDEDTAEGPFFDVDDIIDNSIDRLKETMTPLGEDSDMIKFSDMPHQTAEDLETGELFIDAEAFEFLLNQNKTNMVMDSGKESLFLKFDPLFAKRISTGGMDALNTIHKKASTPKKPITETTSKVSKPLQRGLTYDIPPIAGPSTLNMNDTNSKHISDDDNGDLNITVPKPMMVVTPAVNPTVTPRNKSITPTRTNRRSLTFTSPAIAVIDRLLSLSGNSSIVEHDATVTQSRDQNEAELALTQLRELLADKEIHVYNLRSENKELKDRLTALESQIQILEAQGQDRLTKVNELSDRLSEKMKLNKSMAAVVEEYERTIASLIAETEQDKKRHAEERLQLIKERDEQTTHLASMEVAFNDLHSKYEKSKQVILAFKTNVDAYKNSNKEFEETVTKMQNNYELLKQHATSKLNHANQELEKMNRAHEAEVLKLNAMIKRKELHVTSLEETLAQKTKANEELTAICDELINKVG